MPENLTDPLQVKAKDLGLPTKGFTLHRAFRYEGEVSQVSSTNLVKRVFGMKKKMINEQVSEDTAELRFSDKCLVSDKELMTYETRAFHTKTSHNITLYAAGLKIPVKDVEMEDLPPIFPDASFPLFHKDKVSAVHSKIRYFEIKTHAKEYAILYYIMKFPKTCLKHSPYLATKMLVLPARGLSEVNRDVAEKEDLLGQDENAIASPVVAEATDTECSGTTHIDYMRSIVGRLARCVPSLVGIRYKQGGVVYFLSDKDGNRTSEVFLHWPNRSADITSLDILTEELANCDADKENDTEDSKEYVREFLRIIGHCENDKSQMFLVQWADGSRNWVPWLVMVSRAQVLAYRYAAENELLKCDNWKWLEDLKPSIKELVEPISMEHSPVEPSPLRSEQSEPTESAQGERKKKRKRKGRSKRKREDKKKEEQVFKRVKKDRFGLKPILAFEDDALLL